MEDVKLMFSNCVLITKLLIEQHEKGSIDYSTFQSHSKVKVDFLKKYKYNIYDEPLRTQANQVLYRYEEIKAKGCKFACNV